MRVQELHIEMRMDGMNEIIKAARTHWNVSRQQKIDQQNIVKLCAMKSKMKPIYGPFRMEIVYEEPNEDRDPDNIAAAKKFILDALQEMKLIQNDNMEYVLGWSESWIVVPPAKAGIRIKLIEE